MEDNQLCNPCAVFKSYYGDSPFYCAQYCEDCNGDYREILAREKDNAVSAINSYLRLQKFPHTMSSRTSGEDASKAVRLVCKPGYECQATMTLKCIHDPVNKTVSYCISNVGSYHKDSAGTAMGITTNRIGLDDELFITGTPVTKAVFYAGHGFFSAYEFLSPATRGYALATRAHAAVPSLAVSDHLGGCRPVACREDVLPLPGVLVTLDSQGFASNSARGEITSLRCFDRDNEHNSVLVTTATLHQLLEYAQRNRDCAPVDPEYTTTGKLTGFAVLSSTPNASTVHRTCLGEVWTVALQRPLRSTTLCPGYVVHEIQLAPQLDEEEFLDLLESLSEVTDYTSHDDSSHDNSDQGTPPGPSHKRPRSEDFNNGGSSYGSAGGGISCSLGFYTCDQDSLSTLSLSTMEHPAHAEDQIFAYCAAEATVERTSSSVLLGSLGKVFKLVAFLVVGYCCLWTPVDSALPVPSNIPAARPVLWAPAAKEAYWASYYSNHTSQWALATLRPQPATSTADACPNWSQGAVDDRLLELYQKTGRGNSIYKVPRSKRCTMIRRIEQEVKQQRQREHWVNVADYVM